MTTTPKRSFSLLQGQIPPQPPARNPRDGSSVTNGSMAPAPQHVDPISANERHALAESTVATRGGSAFAAGRYPLTANEAAAQLAPRVVPHRSPTPALTNRRSNNPVAITTQPQPQSATATKSSQTNLARISYTWKTDGTAGTHKAELLKRATFLQAQENKKIAETKPLECNSNGSITEFDFNDDGHRPEVKTSSDATSGSLRKTTTNQDLSTIFLDPDKMSGVEPYSTTSTSSLRSPVNDNSSSSDDDDDDSTFTALTRQSTSTASDFTGRTLTHRSDSEEDLGPLSDHLDQFKPAQDGELSPFGQKPPASPTTTTERAPSRFRDSPDSKARLLNNVGSGEQSSSLTKLTPQEETVET